MKWNFPDSLRHPLLIGLLLSSFVFSVWLMFHTFSYDSSAGQMLISGKAWSDFGGYIPQIRSFSVGSNWPPQYPLFPGEPTRYHFLFYALVGVLESAGLRIDWALNLPSVAGFFLLQIMIFVLGWKIFQSRAVGVVSVLLFLFNGSLSFLDFFKTHPIALSSIPKIVTNTQFSSFGPWNGSLITAFWNLNVYTNQRHLALSFSLALILIYGLYSGSRRASYWAGFILGTFLLLNQAVFAMLAVFVGTFFLFKKSLRFPLMVSVIGILPWILSLRILSRISPPIEFLPGFLTPSPVTPVSFFTFWFLNLGLHLIFIPLGIYLAPKRARIFALPLLVLFSVPNLFRLSVDMINNHKFFNFMLVIGVVFTASVIVKLFRTGKTGKLLAIGAFIFLTLGGVVDFFPVKNDIFYRIPDIKSDPDSGFFYYHVPPRSTVLNTTWFYHPASMAGRFIYNGYPYFTWSFGYDQTVRENITKEIYASPSRRHACNLLLKEKISFIELSNHPEGFLEPNYQMWESEFVPAYTNPKTGLKVFSTSANCKAP